MYNYCRIIDVAGPHHIIARFGHHSASTYGLGITIVFRHLRLFKCALQMLVEMEEGAQPDDLR
jgi:hypothetical protein